MILDLFAGPGGWDEGAKALGLRPVGIEWDPAACLTARAAGHVRVRADVAALPTEPMVGKVTGAIASPPCTDFSTAGKMQGLKGVSGGLVAEVMRYATDIRPRWIACEQVWQVIHVWRVYAAQLRALGYSAWAGVLNAADYGVPQERERAVLLASLDRTVAPPIPTHGRDTTADLFGAARAPHVTMARALGLPAGCEYDSGQNSRAAGGGTERYVRSCDRPAGTVTGKTTSQWVLRGADRRKVTLADSAVLQGFRPDYPWNGRAEERLQQVGNAVPPPFATHLLSAVTGIVVPAVEAAA